MRCGTKCRMRCCYRKYSNLISKYLEIQYIYLNFALLPNKVNVKEIGNINKYVSGVLGLEFTVNPHAPALAPPMNRFFELCAVGIGNMECCLISPMDASVKPSMLIKRVNAVAQSIKKECVLVLDAMDKGLRRGLIKAGVSFIVPDRQLFIPFLGAYLSDIRLNEIDKREKLTPAAQLLILHHLQSGSVENMPLSDIADKLGYPLKTLSKVANELKDAALCAVESTGPRSKSLKFHKAGRDLWEQALPMLSSPVSKTGYIAEEKKEIMPDSVISGDDALSRYTEMGITGSHSLALDRRSDLAKQLIPELETTETSGAMSVELWKYDPGKLAMDGYIDPLSLYLCYMDNPDERIQGQLERLIDNTL